MNSFNIRDPLVVRKRAGSAALQILEAAEFVVVVADGGDRLALLSHSKFTGSGGDDLKGEVLKVSRGGEFVSFFDGLKVID